MPPKDLFDANPVYTNTFFASYCDFLVSHPIMGIEPLQMIEVSMLTEEEYEEIFLMDEDIPIAELMSDSSGYSVDDMTGVSDDEFGGLIRASDLPSIYMDVMIAMGWGNGHVYPGMGTVDDPIDLTIENE